jgi:hypothetical protein
MAGNGFTAQQILIAGAPGRLAGLQNGFDRAVPAGLGAGMQDLIAELASPITVRWSVAVTSPCEDAVVRGDNDEFVSKGVDGLEEYFLFSPGTHTASSRF